HPLFDTAKEASFAYSSGVSTLKVTSGSSTGRYSIRSWCWCSMSRATAVVGARKNFSIISRPSTMGWPCLPPYSGTTAHLARANGRGEKRPRSLAGSCRRPRQQGFVCSHTGRFASRQDNSAQRGAAHVAKIAESGGLLIIDFGC